MSSRSLRRNRRAAAAGALAATLGFAGLGLAASPASAVPGFQLERLAGADRIETAVEISQDTFTSATTALIARADLYPDALAGNYLAGAEQGPILLSHTDHVPEETLAELDRLGVTDVTLLGGTAALSDTVESELEAAGLTVNREAGTDRYKTAAEIATSQPAAGIGEVDGARTAILATGERFPDALTGGPLAYAGSHPILLTPTATLGADAAGALETLGIEHVIILGGTAAVSQAAEDAVEAAGMTTERLAGATRYSTATEIAEWAIANAGFTNTHVDVATGQNFPDALTGGPHAGENTSPIILANDGNTAEAVAFLQSISSTVAEGHIFGGTAAVSAAVEAALEAAGQTAPASATSRPELVSAAILDVVTVSEASPTKPAGTYVAYSFDENIDLFAAAPAAFQLYNADGTLDQATATSVTVSGSTATAYFAGIITDADAATLTLATVVEGAVTDNQNQDNPEGASGIGSNVAPGTALPAGTTSAPDLVSVGNFRQGAQNGETAVDFVFDEAATQVAAAPAADTFFLIQTNGSVAQCEGPGEDADAVAASGGTVAGGDGTTTFTVICTNPGITLATPNGTPLTATNVARGVVDGGEVTDASGNANVQQAADVASTSADPDLVSITLQPSAGTTADGILAVFDENVTDVVTVGSVFAYGVDGTPTAANGFDVNDSNRTQVLFTFPDGTIDAAGAEVVGLYVEDGAVVASDDATGNQEDEVGAANQTTGTQTVGATAAPQLVSVALSQTTDTFGNVTGVKAAYTFDEAVDGDTDASFFLYLADGTKLTASACAIDNNGTAAVATDDVTVNCTAFGVATNAQILSATLGTVGAGAVSELQAANQSNPEGDAFTTGGTGTAAA